MLQKSSCSSLITLHQSSAAIYETPIEARGVRTPAHVLVQSTRAGTVHTCSPAGTEYLRQPPLLHPLQGPSAKVMQHGLVEGQSLLQKYLIISGVTSKNKARLVSLAEGHTLL